MSNTNLVGFMENDDIHAVILERWGAQAVVNVPKEVLDTFRKAVDTLPKRPPQKPAQPTEEKQ
jgi:hypothetical protein